MKLLRNLENKLLNYYNNNLTKKIFMTILVSVCIYSTFLLLIPGIPKGHDLSFHLSRISAIKDGLILGDFPVRIYANYIDGYGYANGLFYADIFLYIPAILNLIGLDIITSYKIFLLICTVLTALSMYYCVKVISKSKFAAIISTIVYTLAPYRIADVYIRSAVGEILAFIFLPIIILGLYEIIFGNFRRWYIVTLGFAGLFLSHNISAVLMVGFTALILCCCIKVLIKDIRRLGYFILATFTTILLVGFLLFPIAEQLVNESFILNTQTISSEIWNSTMPVYKIILGFPYSILYLPGISGVGITLTLISLIRIKLKRDSEKSFKFLDICLAMGLISLVAVTSMFPWKIILKLVKYLSAIQFAWRLYLFATVFLAISSGLIVLNYYRNAKDRIRIFNIILMLSILSCSINMFMQYAAYGYYEYKGLNKLNISKYSIGLGEYLPEGTDVDKLYSRGETITSNNNLLSIDYTKKGTEMKILFSNNEENGTYIEVPLIYYLGYEAKYTKDNIEYHQLNVTKGENNTIRIYLNKYKEGNILLEYKGTKIQSISLLISFITFIGLALWIIYFNHLNNKMKNINSEVEFYGK